MRDRRVFLTILCLTILVSLTGGISIVMLVPMLGLLNVSEGAASALRWLAVPLLAMPYEEQMIALVAEYFLLNVHKALLSQTLSIQENLFWRDIPTICVRSCTGRYPVRAGRSLRQAGRPIRPTCSHLSASRSAAV